MKKETKADLYYEVNELWMSLCKMHKEADKEKIIPRMVFLVERPYAVTVSFLTELRNDLKRMVL